jgi:hypothetical protein
VYFTQNSLFWMKPFTENDVIIESDFSTNHLLVVDFLSSQLRMKTDRIRMESVAEPPELFQLKCVSLRYTADTNSTHFKRNNSLVCRVSARCNHGPT